MADEEATAKVPVDHERLHEITTNLKELYEDAKPGLMSWNLRLVDQVRELCKVVGISWDITFPHT